MRKLRPREEERPAEAEQQAEIPEDWDGAVFPPLSRKRVILEVRRVGPAPNRVHLRCAASMRSCCRAKYDGFGARLTSQVPA